MAWDSSRQVPWKRLVRDWLLYVGVMVVVFLIVMRDDLSITPFISLLVSGPLFVGVGAILAKFGYSRKTLRDLRAETAQRQAEQAAAAGATRAGARRAKPAPTSRTGGGGRSGGNRRKR